MSKGLRPESAKDTAEAFARADWKTLLPQLLRGAVHYLRVLGLAEGDNHRPALLEAMELVNTALESCLAGERQLTVEAGASEDGLVSFLSEIMRSIAMNRRTSAAATRCDGDDALDQQPDESPSPSRRLAARSLLDGIERAFEGDAEAGAVLGVLAEGHEDRAEIAEALGWTVPHVKVVRRRMSRRLASKRMTLNDDGEAGPPSSGPQGRDHETPQAAGERRRASGERDGGAGVARRRRSHR
jgi:DNA-directed RNA polymerase specialized sigma24 family protein